MWCSISSSGDLSQQLLCSQQPNKRLLSAHAVSILLRLSRSIKMGLNNRVIPHTVSLWSEQDARLSGTTPEIRELLVLHSTRCWQGAGGQRCLWAETHIVRIPGLRSLCAQEEAPTGDAWKHPSQHSDAPPAYGHRSVCSSDSAFNVTIFKRGKEQMKQKYLFQNENDCGRG